MEVKKRNYIVQDQLLDKAIETGSKITFFLKSKLQLSGSVRQYDTFTVWLEDDTKFILLFKNSVTSMRLATSKWQKNKSSSETV